MSASSKTAIKSCKAQDRAKRALKALSRTHDSPLSERIYRALVANDDAALLREKIRPEEYSSSRDFAKDYLLVSYLSKYEGLNAGVDPKQVALSNFAVAESVCRQTNERLRQGRTSIVDPILYRAQCLISKVLGVFSFDKMAGLERWGPGASVDIRRKEAYLDEKLAKLPISVTKEAAAVFLKVVQSDLHWSELILESFPEGPHYQRIMDKILNVVEGSRITTVKKNAKTDRTIAIEPRGNMFLQKAFGNYLRKRLKRFGVDLDTQALNQHLASVAQKLGLATIDLSMASDTVCSQLIFALFPFEWAVYLDQIRTRRYTLGKTQGVYEKFSSMGNGFTFELESLIFFALTKASMEDENAPFAIYGDDIILPSSDAPVLITVLNYCGFTVNEEKSFVDGPFRESCGRHYFNGDDVTPLYQKEVVSDDHSFMRFCNRLKRYAVKHNDGTSVQSWTNNVWQSMYRTLGTAWRPFISAGMEGDDGFVVCHNDVADRKIPYDKVYGHLWPVIIKRIPRIPARENALLAYALRLRHGGGILPWWDAKTPCDGEEGLIPSLDESSVVYVRTTRRCEAPWEFALG